jgi:hypothetical protein
MPDLTFRNCAKRYPAPSLDSGRPYNSFKRLLFPEEPLKKLAQG